MQRKPRSNRENSKKQGTGGKVTKRKERSMGEEQRRRRWVEWKEKGGKSGERELKKRVGRDGWDSGKERKRAKARKSLVKESGWVVFGYDFIV